MKPSVKIELEGSSVIVHARMPSWEEAMQEVIAFRADPPDGYRLKEGHVTARAKSGRGVNVKMDFEHCKEDIPPFELQEAYDFFRKELGFEKFRQLPEAESQSGSA